MIFTPFFKKFCCFVFLLLITTIASANTASSTAIEHYIEQNWTALTRSVSDCQAYHDPKIGADRILYLPRNFRVTPHIRAIQKKCHIQIKHLPKIIKQIGDLNTNEISPHGLLYLPYPYVVPGGRFNEMYGWDSYFIILGLLHAGKIELARHIIENYFFEIEYYGSILNANRTYHLSRSQPPFLTAAILALYKQIPRNKNNRQWLVRAYRYATKNYSMWTKPPYLAGKTRLSRYYDNETNQLIETRAYPHYYQRVYQYIKQHPAETAGYLVNSKQSPTLSPDFYQGERSLRASGFDITHRFGPFGGRTHHYAAVCLNSLLYQTEKDLAKMATWLGKKTAAKKWQRLAKRRQIAMKNYLYDSKTGLFVDYDFILQKKIDLSLCNHFLSLMGGISHT